MKSGRSRAQSRPSPSGARLLAARVLREMERRHAFSNRMLSEHLERHPELDPRERASATNLVYGVLRHRRRLDHLIDAFATDPRRLRGEVRQILRIGAYELVELDRPPAIAISQALAGMHRLDTTGRGGKAVQAILGRIGREGAELETRLEQRSVLDVLELRWSIPRWWAGRWLAQLGPERALRRARALAQTPPLDVRIDLSRISRLDAMARLHADHPEATIEIVESTPSALHLRGAGDVFHGPMHAQGLISVQSAASQQPARMLDPRAGERVLDACAGIGVKTLQLAELMNRSGTIVAVDEDSSRLEICRENLTRGSVGTDLRVVPIVGDATTPDLSGVDDGTGFDAVLVDAPCTGLGNVARHPEIRWLRKFDDIGARSVLQRQLLMRCLSRLHGGGRLMYSVCSLEPEEGPDIVTAVVAQTGAEVVGTRTWTPEDDGNEGFFMALLRV